MQPFLSPVLQVFWTRLRNQPTAYRYHWPREWLRIKTMGQMQARLVGRPSLQAEWWDAWDDYRVLRRLGPMASRRYHALMPLAYLQGKVDFMGHEIRVKPPILIPRADTAAWLEQAMTEMSPGSHILEVGTGSGCIAKVLSAHGHSVTAIDVDPRAVALARLNCGRDVTVVCADLFSASISDEFDWIVSNPPYIPEQDWSRGRLGPSVCRWESRLALTPPVGVERMYSRLLELMPFARRGLMVETDGTRPSARMIERLSASWGTCRRLRDHAGRIRALVIIKK